MTKTANANSRRFPIPLMFAITFAAAVLSAPAILFDASAKGIGSGLRERTTSHDESLPNYDIRTDREQQTVKSAFRQNVGVSASEIADIRDAFVRGEKKLQTSIQGARVEYSSESHNPEVIGTANGFTFAPLTASAAGERPWILKRFIAGNSELFGVNAPQISGLETAADYTNPDGVLSFVELAQKFNGVAVFRGEVKAAFTKRNEVVRMVNNLAPGIDEATLSAEFGDPGSAIRNAAKHVGDKAPAGESSVVAVSDGVFRSGEGDWATTAEKVYFPIEPGVAVPAWRVLFWLPVDAYYVIVDAESGKLLWRKNIAEDQTQSASFRVWNNPNGFINLADSPFPLTPGPAAPNGQQGPALARQLVSLVGNEPPYQFNTNGWIPDGQNETDGNNVEAGLDRDTTNGVDAINGRAVGANRVFDFPFSPYNPNTGTGEPPLPPGGPSGCSSTPPEMIDAQKAAVTQYFYITNWTHAAFYSLGFTEAARNFQHLNFGRGGIEGDRLSAESQDCSGTNGANFASPADGTRPRMQMFIWTGPPVDIDTAVDAQIVIHEFTHGLSNRLHGNSTGLTTNMARAMGEGWSDFYATALLSSSDDPANGVHAVAGYTTNTIFSGFTNNYYYGIRRYPQAVLSYTGGINNKPHNALTFSFANTNCNPRLSEAEFAFPRGLIGGTSCDQIHNLGEIWATTLWEVRARFVQRLGHQEGNRRMLQFVTDGMKISPLAPNFLQARDAILAAAQASSLAPESAADVADIWAGFAARGMGVSASIQNPGTGNNNTVVTEAFDTPGLTQTPALMVDDSDGNGSGYPDPGESITIDFPLTNNSGVTANNVSVQLAGGGSAVYGNIGHTQTVVRSIAFIVPNQSPCGAVVELEFQVSSSLGDQTIVRTITLGQPIVTTTENFDGTTAPDFPAGWTAQPVSNGINFVTSTSTPFSSPNAAFAANPATVGGGTDLVSPSIAISSPSATVSFRNNYATEAGWDGGVLEVSIGEGAFQDVIAAGGAFLENGYNGVLGSNGVNNPLAGRIAWTGNSGGYLRSVVRLPAAAAGQNVRLKWRFGADNNTAVLGWFIDDIEIAASAQCVSTQARAIADFDGDGRTDLSVFRPGNGVWYLLRSAEGFAAYSFGLSGDVITPGDFDGDGRADVAVWRPESGTWYLLRSTDGFAAFQFGAEGDIPVAADFDGDGKTDVAVFRPQTGVWYILNSGGGATTIIQFGQNGDVPVRGDFDGDGRIDLSVFRGGEWWILKSTGGVAIENFGTTGDIVVAADFDGDGTADPAVFRPSDGIWYILRSSDRGVTYKQFGQAGDVPSPGDFDGDGRADTAIFREGVWYIDRSTAGLLITSFGVPDDQPVPAGYVR
ncbi:MAG: M36 family metallopeptidase [Acidobacteria bacterium]|nr:M36 family metallopeptidase [Acidobacteriota bacterium]